MVVIAIAAVNNDAEDVNILIGVVFIDNGVVIIAAGEVIDLKESVKNATKEVLMHDGVIKNDTCNVK